MSTERDFDRLARAWMAEGPEELADRVLDAVFDEVHLARRARRPRALLRGFPAKRGLMRFGVAAIIAGMVVALAVVVGGRPAEVTRPTAPPLASPPASTQRASARPTPTPRPQVPLVRQFSSTVNHFSISYPDGWTVTPATEVYRYGSSLSLKGPKVDVIAAPDGRTSLYITSLAIPRGTSENTWHLTQDQLLPDGPTTCAPGVGGFGQPRHAIPVAVGDVAGRAGEGCEFIQYLTPITRGRGYEFLLFPTPVGLGTEEEKSNRDLFVAMLGSVELDP